MKSGIAYIIFGAVATGVGIILTILRAVPASSLDPELIPRFSVIINDTVINVPTLIGVILGAVILIVGIDYYRNSKKK